MRVVKHFIYSRLTINRCATRGLQACHGSLQEGQKKKKERSHFTQFKIIISTLKTNVICHGKFSALRNSAPDSSLQRQ